MKNLPMYAGLDYHQASIQVCVVDAEGRRMRNQRCASDVADVVNALSSTGEIRSIGIESCSGAAEFAEELSNVTGWPVTLAHPGYVNRMKLNPDKSDFTDAQMLADLTQVGYIPKVWLAPREIRELRSLVRHRQSCVENGKATKLQLSSLLRTRRVKAPPWAGTRWTKMWFEWIRDVELSGNDRWLVDRLLDELEYRWKQIKRVEKRLTEVTANDRMVQALMTLPNVGPVTAWLIRAEIAWASRFRTGKQMSRFCGVSPRNSSSGERVADSGLIRAGNRHLKTVIIQAAHRLIRCDERWSAFAERLGRAGKPKCVVVGAVANRWVRWLFHRMNEFEATVREEGAH